MFREGNKSVRNYRIGDFAQAMAVSPDFIKYYEKIHLLEPQVNEKNRYRFLAFGQSRWAMEIRKYRNLGFSAEQIDVLLNQSDLGEIVAALDAKREEEERAAIWLGLASEQLEYVRRAVDRSRKAEEWTIATIEAGLFLPHTEGKEFITTRATREIFSEWVSYMPVARSCCLLTLSPGKGEGGGEAIERYQFGLFVLRRSAELLGLRRDGPVVLLPERRCVESCYEAPEVDRMEDIRLDRLDLARTVREHRLALSGEVLVSRLLSYRRGEERRKLDLIHATLA
jgi:DNA-binding transcriptional MerR regulator